MSHPNEELITKFYSAFSKRDADTMASVYAPDARFTDPVFPDLVGPRIGAMWKMLGSRAEGLKIEFRDVSADDSRGKAHWEAWYPFSATGRNVHNIIDAEFEFKDGLVVRHVDTFDFGRWSKQALGLPAYLFGWTGMLQPRVQKSAGEQLDKWIARHG